MLRPRISIGRLMVVIVLFAVSLAALSRPTRLWAALVFGGMVVILIGTTIRWFSERGDRRNFYRGFFVAGWIGFLLHFGPIRDLSAHQNQANGFGSFLVDLPSLFILDNLHDLGERIGVIQDSLAGSANTSPTYVTIGPFSCTTERATYWVAVNSATIRCSVINIAAFGAGQHPGFIQIGYSMICLLIAFAGGWYGRRLGRITRSVSVPDQSSGEK